MNPLHLLHFFEKKSFWRTSEIPLAEIMWNLTATGEIIVTCRLFLNCSFWTFLFTLLISKTDCLIGKLFSTYQSCTFFLKKPSEKETIYLFIYYFISYYFIITKSEDFVSKKALYIAMETCNNVDHSPRNCCHWFWKQKSCR